MTVAGVRTVAVFGGSFNPPHVAHQLACLWTLETQGVSEVRVVPTWRHRFGKQLAPFADRLEMCRLAMAPLGPRVIVSAIEEELGGEASRTLVTLEALAAREPDVRWRLVIGADILPEREKWWRWSDVERLAPPIVLGRSGQAVPHELAPEGGAVELASISSTEVRARIARGAPIASLVPKSVLTYLQQRRLYST